MSSIAYPKQWMNSPNDFKHYMDFYIEYLEEHKYGRREMFIVYQATIGYTLKDSFLTDKNKVIELKNAHKAYEEVMKNYLF